MKLKTLIQITAHVYGGHRDTYAKVEHPERVYSFIRPRGAKKPTFAGAARMVAKELEVFPRAVAVTRIEAASYLTK